ncbi:MAG TPA: redoxin domain-containing protein [Terriglobales bacterium]|nr:redoxin domain-containing protein [Terriglobales bacterium]
MFGLGTYNYGRFNRQLLQEMASASFSGPGPGDRAPDFKAAVLEGEMLRLSDFRNKKNVLLIFGSATCPITAAVISRLNQLYDKFRGNDTEFIFVYTREAHPGERIRAHRSNSEKQEAAHTLRDQENIAMPVAVDDVRGSIHRKYSGRPSTAFLIDRSGRVAFRSMWARPEGIEAGIERLLELQHERGVDHVVVNGGQDLTMPVSYAALSSYRALERGGDEALRDFREALGLPARVRQAESRDERSLFERPGRIIAVGALTAAVLAGGLYAGFELRKKRLGLRRNPYRAYEKEKIRDTETGEDYGAVGI